MRCEIIRYLRQIIQHNLANYPGLPEKKYLACLERYRFKNRI